MSVSVARLMLSPKSWMYCGDSRWYAYLQQRGENSRCLLQGRHKVTNSVQNVLKFGIHSQLWYDHTMSASNVTACATSI